MVQKRKRRDYRNARKAQFTRPEPGFSLYEGRTRGKRIRYTYSDEEGESDALSTRRSNRQSGMSTPAEPVGPTFTASGRQVRSRHGGVYGETMHSGQHEEREQPATDGIDNGLGEGGEQQASTGRSRRSGYNNGVGQKPRSQEHIEGYNSVDDMEDESDASSSGGEWDGGGDDNVDDNIVDEEDDADEDVSDDDASVAKEEEDGEEYGERRSLVVALRYHKSHASSIDNTTSAEGGPPGSLSRHETPVSGPYATVQTGSPAPPIDNIHAAVAEPCAHLIPPTDSAPNGNTLNHQLPTQYKQDSPPALA